MSAGERGKKGGKGSLKGEEIFPPVGGKGMTHLDWGKKKRKKKGWNLG